MYKELHYVADQLGEDSFRDFLRSLGLTVTPERPGGEVALTNAEIEKNRHRLLSFRPVEQLEISYTDPYPHYSPARQPLIEWDVPHISGTVILTGYLRHHAYMEREGSDFVRIGAAFAEIRKWMKANWRPLNKFDFISPGAEALINERGYTWSCVDPEHTKFAIVRSGGKEEEVSFREWMRSRRDS